MSRAPHGPPVAHACVAVGTLAISSMFAASLVALEFGKTIPGLVLLLVTGALSAIVHWNFIHAAVHGKLLRSRTANELVGRILSILFGAPFEVFKRGHLMHHAYTRSPLDAPDMVKTNGVSRLVRSVFYYLRLCGGLYCAEVLLSLLVFLPNALLCRMADKLPDETRAMVLPCVASARSLALARQDMALICALVLLAGLAVGDAWIAVAAFIGGRALAISIFDNAFHYRASRGAVAWNFATSPLVAQLLLNSNFHRTHHKYPRAAWVRLPELFALDRDRYDGHWAAGVARQFRGPASQAIE